MTGTSDTFGAFALAALTVFALWTSTLTAPLAAPVQTPAPIAAPAVA
jgi:hypothetical protein